MISYWYQMDKSHIHNAKKQITRIHNMFIHTHMCIYVVIYIKFKDRQNNSISCLGTYAYIIKILKGIDMLYSG